MLERSIPLVLHPDPTCAWCHRARFPGRDFPVGISSNICREHAEWMLAQAGLHRQNKEREGTRSHE